MSYRARGFAEYVEIRRFREEQHREKGEKKQAACEAGLTAGSVDGGDKEKEAYQLNWDDAFWDTRKLKDSREDRREKKRSR